MEPHYWLFVYFNGILGWKKLFLTSLKGSCRPRRISTLTS